MANAISALLFLDSKGKPVIFRDYRWAARRQAGERAAVRAAVGAKGGKVAQHPAAPAHSRSSRHPAAPLPTCRGDIPVKAADRFMSKLNELEETGKASPVIRDENTSYIYVQVRRAPARDSSGGAWVWQGCAVLCCTRGWLRAAEVFKPRRLPSLSTPTCTCWPSAAPT